jgi:hypothetical protein
VRVIAITQQVDLSGPVANLIASLLFGIAEIELQHSKERQAVGIALEKNAASTLDTGRPATPFSWSPVRRLSRWRRHWLPPLPAAASTSATTTTASATAGATEDHFARRSF